MTQVEREHAARVLGDMKDRLYLRGEIATGELKVILTAIAALREPKPEIVTLPSACTVEPPKDAQPLRADVQDACDRLRWLLSQAERVVTVDAEDRRAVERACKLLAEAIKMGEADK